MRYCASGAILALALAACSGGEKAAKETGGVSLTISGLGASGTSSGQAVRAAATPPPAAFSQVKLVVLRHTGPDGGGEQAITEITNPLTRVFNPLPIGLYSFSATAYDGTDVATARALFSGQVLVSVHKNEWAGVNLVLQQLVPPGTIENGSPVIRSIVVSDAAPAVGQTITFTADVKDSSSDQLGFQWTASCSGPLVKDGVAIGPAEGEVFSNPTATVTSFTSYCSGDETITFAVTQSSAAGGRTAAASFTLQYSAQGRNLAIVFNSFPDVLDITTANPANNTQPPWGGRVNLVATVADVDGDAITAAWKDSCGGSFDDPTSLTPVWTAPRAPLGTKPSASPMVCKLAVSLTDGRGGKNAGWLTVHVGLPALVTVVKQLPLPRFAYVPNYSPGSVSAFAVNAWTGALTLVATTTADPSSHPVSVTVAPSGKFAYVADSGTNVISSYPVNPDGSLGTASSVATLTSAPISVAIDPSGKLAFVGHDGAVNVYSIDAATGGFTAQVDTLTVGKTLTALRLDPAGRFLFVANASTQRDAAILMYAIGPSGALTAVGSPAPVGPGLCRSLDVDPTGRFLFGVRTNSTGALLAFGIDAIAGLTAVDSPPAGRNPGSVAVDPSGRFVYTANISSNNISGFAIDSATGMLTSLGPDVPTGNTNAKAIGVDPSGKFVYVTSDSNSPNVSVFAIGASGALTASTSTATAGFGPYGITFVGGYPPPLAYVANRGLANGNTISALTIDSASGALTNTGTFPVAGIPLSVGLDPLGRFAYVTLGTDQAPYSVNSVLVFGIDPFTGALTNTGSVALPPLGASEPAPYHVAVEPSGRFAYVADYRKKSGGVFVGRIVAYQIDQTTGALTYVNEVINPLTYQLAADPSGQFLYAMANNGYGVSTYRIDASTGALTVVTNSAWTDPTLFKITGSQGDLGVDPFGRFVYTTTTNQSKPAVNAIAIDAATGLPTTMVPYPMPSGNTVAVVVDPTGRFAYAIGANPLPKIFAFSIDPGTGALSSIGTAEVPGSHYGAFRLAMDPSGAFLYATTYFGTAVNNEPGAVVTFAIDPFTGALTRVNVPAAATGPQPFWISVLPGRASWTYASVPTKPQRVLGGTVSGLSGTLVLVNGPGADTLTLTTNGTFRFTKRVVQGAAYSVTVQTQPSGQTCVVTDGAGTMGAADFLGIGVACTTNPPPTTFTIGGTVTGAPALSAAASIVLQDNGANDLTVAGSGSFGFATAIAAGGSYSVTVLRQPSFLSCSVSNGSGQNVQANVTDVAVACTTNPGLGAVCTAASGTLDTAECGNVYSYCHSFNSFTPPLRCTMRCSVDADCPIGSNGAQKCNNEGYCRP